MPEYDDHSHSNVSNQPFGYIHEGLPKNEPHTRSVPGGLNVSNSMEKVNSLDGTGAPDPGQTTYQSEFTNDQNHFQNLVQHQQFDAHSKDTPTSGPQGRAI
jgi:hypothetical protein